MIRPSSINAARSASAIVDGRCTTTSAVQAARIGRSARSTRASVCTSSADSGSSSTSTRGRPTIARAEREPLPLPSRKRQTLFADPRLESPRQFVGERRLRDLERGLDIGFGRVGMADQQVLAHAGREQGRFLERESDLRAQAAQRQVTYVVPVEEHAARVHVVQPREQRGNTRLAGARGADERERLARMDLEIEPAQHRLLVSGIAEVDGVESHFTVGAAERDRARPVGDDRLGVEHFPHPARGGLGLFGHREDPGELFDREHQDQQIRHERDEATHGQRARRHRKRADQQHRGERDVRDQTEHPDELRMDPHPFELGVAQLQAPSVEPAEHLVAATERLQHADPACRLLEHGGEIAGLILNVAHDEVIRAFESPAQHEHRNRSGDREQAERHVEVQQEREDREHLDDDDHEEDRAEGREPADQRDVGVRGESN